MVGDLAAQMVAGIDRFFQTELDASVAHRRGGWQRDFSSHENYLRSIEPNRERFRQIIGLADSREPAQMQATVTIPSPSGLSTQKERGSAAGNGYRVYPARWSVLKGVDAEGVLLQPDGEPIAYVVALPDCDWTPEMLVGLVPGVPPQAQFARRLAQAGCCVLVPALIDRREAYSGIPQFRMTNQPHREFLYRAAYEVGRHIIGYEVQKVLAAVDWFTQSSPKRPVGVIGYGEGGLITFYAAASDTRIDAAAVSGYFQPREGLWQEPIYRNVFSLLREFGDAEIAGLIAPRPIVVEACRHPEIAGPPPEADDRKGAAPGKLTTPPLDTVEAEYRRALDLLSELKPPPSITLVPSGDGSGLPGCDAALRAFLRGLVGINYQPAPPNDFSPPSLPANWPDADDRLRRQFDQILQHTQHLMREAEFVRRQFWSKSDASSVKTWQKNSRWYRNYLWDEIIGRLPPATLPPNPRTRRIYETPRFTGYEVVLDVYDDVFAYGILLLPKDIGPGERRPVVVCQHGLEGRPQEVANPDGDNHHYHSFACRLVERGFITYAPQNPYIGGNNFRQILRKANPLKGSLYGVIVRQHEQTLRWLSSLPYVDPDRIAFYGLSYGGKTAMRIPALLEGYCLVICSADYNEWIWKNVSARHVYSYLISGEYDMPEFNLGNTFNYAELSWLISPRPFMVERGHNDAVAPDEWVAYEYAKTRRHYTMLGIGERTEIEFFNGPHTINGAGTFDFLERFLKKH